MVWNGLPIKIQEGYLYFGKNPIDFIGAPDGSPIVEAIPGKDCLLFLTNRHIYRLSGYHYGFETCRIDFLGHVSDLNHFLETLAPWELNKNEQRRQQSV